YALSLHDALPISECATCASTSPGTSRATRSGESCAASWPWSPPSTSSPGCCPSSTRTPPIPVRPPKAPVDARPGRSGRTCPRAGWTPASSTPAGNRCCLRLYSTSLEDDNALRPSPAHLGADGERGGLFAIGRRAVGERTGEESTSLGLPARPCPRPPFLRTAPP